jgi:hypothetical protein
MHTQTLQRLREEVEAASTLHLALGRIARRADPEAPTAWTGPLLEELEDLAEDDGGFAHSGLAEIRRRSGAALVAQFHAVAAAVSRAPEKVRPVLQSLLDATLVMGTQDPSIPRKTSISGALSMLVKSAGLRLDATMRAAMVARDGVQVEEPPAPNAVPRTKKKPVSKVRAKKRSVKKKVTARKTPPRTAATSRSKVTKKRRPKPRTKR